MPIAQYITWDPDPIALQIGPVAVRWYGLCWALSFMMGYFLFRYFWKKERIPEIWMEKLAVYVFVGAIVGARMGMVLFWDPEYYFSNPIEIVKIWNGGLASHGGALGLIIAVLLFSKFVSKRSALWTFDRLVITVALAGMFIRIGNLMNSEIVGTPTDSDLGFVFQSVDQHPNFKAEYLDKETVQLHLDPGPDQPRLPRPLRVLRSGTDSLWTEVGIWNPNSVRGEDGWFSYTDPVGPHVVGLHYRLELAGPEVEARVKGLDTTDTRRAVLLQSLDVARNAFIGEYVGDSLRMRLQVPDRGGRMMLKIWRSDEGGHWRLLKRSEIPYEMRGKPLDFADLGDGTDVRYRITQIDDDYVSLYLVPRHPGQLYEAVAYLLLFLLLFGMYIKMDGRVPLGRIFGIFLIILFTARFVIEYWKADQVDFEQGLPINMGQILSIPFIIAGVIILVRSFGRTPVKGVDYGMPDGEEAPQSPSSQE